MRRSAVLRTASAAGLAAAVVAAMTGLAPGAHASSPSRAALAGSAPTWLAHAKHLGATNHADRQSLQVYLAPKGGEAALKAAVAAVSTPGSAQYRHFLTPAAYYNRFAPSAAETSSVTAWLKSVGLTVTSADAHNRFLNVTGSAAAAESAFGVSLQTYSHDGQTVQAPSGTASVPTSVASSVLAVSGLDTTVRTSKVQAAPPPAFANGRPCSAYYGQILATDKADYTTPLPTFEGKTLPYAVCGYTGPQFRAAYEGGTTLDGTGATVGIIDAYAAPTIAKDAEEYATDNGDGSYAPGQLTQTKFTPFTHQGLCGPSGWYGEETLDVEAVHAMAPAADIHFYGAASCLNDDLLTAARTAVDQDTVQIISNSYGDTEANATADYIAASEQVFMQGAMEGIGFTFSSGDDGDELQATGIKQADYQTSDPYVTAVGGTSTAIGRTGNLEGQTGWGTEKYSLSGSTWKPVGYLYGSGGGYSKLFNRPSYQDGVVPANAPAGRAVPDVAMDADPTTGMLIGESQTYPDGKVAYGQYRIGGTSLASPLFAGMTALRIQAAGSSLGFLNPTIYGQVAQGAGTFTDVKGPLKDVGNVRVDYVNGVDPTDGLLYSVRTFNQDSSLVVTKGWDDVTGVGVPSPAWLTTP